MDSTPTWIDLARRTKLLLIGLGTTLIDVLFLALWVYAQSWLNTKVIDRFALQGIESWMLLIFKVLFALATLVPVLAFTFVDVYKLVVRAIGEIRQAN